MATIITIDGPSGAGKGTSAACWRKSCAFIIWIAAPSIGCWGWLQCATVWIWPINKALSTLAGHMDIDFEASGDGA